MGKLTGQLHNRINEIHTLTKFTNFKTRLNFFNANIIGKLNFLHKVINFKEPKAIFNMFKNVENRRTKLYIKINGILDSMDQVKLQCWLPQ